MDEVLLEFGKNIKQLDEKIDALQTKIKMIRDDITELNRQRDAVRVVMNNYVKEHYPELCGF